MPVQITIIGLGQIGTSIGLALKSRGASVTLMGHDKDQRTAKAAQEAGAVDTYKYNLPDSVRDARIVVLAVPFADVRETLEVIAPDLQEGTLVLDTALSKGTVAAWAKELLPEGRFYVGIFPTIHPDRLHGIDSGVAAASADLFEKSVMVVTAPYGTPENVFKLTTDFISLLGSLPLLMDTAEADGLLFREAGLPPGVFNYVPGRSRVMGDLLVDHPEVRLIAFTGSMEVGLRIIERAGRTHPSQPAVKKVIAEMGGKNAIIIDDDADLDEAVPAVMRSAFGYQGQKCSACSRAILVDAIYARFLERLLDVARSVRIGPAEDPAYFMGPVIDRSAQEKILEYVGLARQEGRVAFVSEIPDRKGFYVPLTIATEVPPDHRLAQEEIFGPVLSILRARDFDQALDWANATRFALTGGLFSRTPSHIERCRREFRVGNLYINRGTTGAIVGRQPFGGFKMSGVGSKACGQDYLLQFLDARVVTENTMRRGFVPLDRLSQVPLIWRNFY